MADQITADDVRAIDPSIDAAQATAMLRLVLAKAYVAAPCLRTTSDPEIIEAMQAIVVPAVVRWASTPAGMDVSETGGLYSYSAKTPGGLLWKSELAELQQLCTTSSGSSGRPRGSFPAPRAYPDGID